MRRGARGARAAEAMAAAGGMCRVALALPVVRSKWVYCVVHGAFEDDARVAASSAATGWRAGAEARVRKIGDWVHAEATEFWESAAAAPRGSVKGRVHAVIESALDRIPSEETFLRDCAGLGHVPLRVHHPDRCARWPGGGGGARGCVSVHVRALCACA